MGSCVLRSSGLTTNWSRLVSDLAKPFGYQYEQQDVQCQSWLTCNSQ